MPLSKEPKGTPTSRYYYWLADQQCQLTLYEEAEAVASRALALEPSVLRLRLKRALVRKEMGNLHGALADFNAVLVVKPSYPYALKNRDELLKKLEAQGARSDIQEESLPPVDAQGEVPGEYDHWGNHTPCRFYNHQGCFRGLDCKFSHSVDNKSVRDLNNKNVCLYYLLGKCKWADNTCIYLHSKYALPADSANGPPKWWNDESRIEQIRERLAAREIQNKKDHQKRNEIMEKRINADRRALSRAMKQMVRDRLEDDWNEMDGEMYEEMMDQRARNGGYTDGDVMELLSQGVKPWDDDADAVLGALHGY